MDYFMSDIHGFYDELLYNMHILKNRNFFKNEKDRLIFMGDYIDKGPDSYKVLDFIFKLQKKYGNSKIVVLKGDYENDFLEFLKAENAAIYFDEDIKEAEVLKTFVEESVINAFEKVVSDKDDIIYAGWYRNYILKNHGELVKWLEEIPLYYENEHQICVHAGINEDTENKWKEETDNYLFLYKYPPEIGFFYKDIISGHNPAIYFKENVGGADVFFDGKSHYYIDGDVVNSGQISLVAFDETDKKYYKIKKDGSNICLNKY